jgi:hypothetical protein
MIAEEGTPQATVPTTPAPGNHRGVGPAAPVVAWPLASGSADRRAWSASDSSDLRVVSGLGAVFDAAR